MWGCSTSGMPVAVDVTLYASRRFRCLPGRVGAPTGHADRVRSFRDYCYGLMLLLPRKSIEPIAASLDPEIALQQVRETLDAGITPGIVLADAAYGKVTVWREQLAEWGLSYCVGISDDLSVWAPGTEPLPPEWSGQGRPPIRWQQTTEHHPVSADTLAHALENAHYQTVTWREGTNKALQSRFAAYHLVPGYLPADPTQEWPLGAAVVPGAQRQLQHRLEAQAQAAAGHARAYNWVNTVLGNVKHAITGSYHAIRGHHVPRYLAEFEYRFNRRYDLTAMIPRFLTVAARTPPMPYRLLKLAEPYT